MCLTKIIFPSWFDLGQFTAVNGNPSGIVFTEEKLKIIERIVDNKDLLVITDEIYEYLVYDRKRHISPVTNGSLRGSTVSIMGFFKTFSVTGCRLGYTVA